MLAQGDRVLLLQDPGGLVFLQVLEGLVQVVARGIDLALLVGDGFTQRPAPLQGRRDEGLVGQRAVEGAARLAPLGFQVLPNPRELVLEPVAELHLPVEPLAHLTDVPEVQAH